jgi:hypothetical protein
VNISPSNEILWNTKIPKKQITSDYGSLYASFSAQVTDDNIYLLFNDNPKNLTNKDPKKTFNFNGKGSVVTLVTIGENGEYEKSLITKNSSDDLVVRPKICQQISTTEMLLYAEIKYKFKLGTLTFQ